jgi:hypothetical protein
MAESGRFESAKDQNRSRGLSREGTVQKQLRYVWEIRHGPLSS